MSYEQFDDATLWAFVDGEATATTQRSIIATLREDAALAERIDAMLQQTEMATAAMAADLSNEPPAALRDLIDNAVGPIRRARPNWIAPVTAIAASILVAVGIGAAISEWRLDQRLTAMAKKTEAQQVLLARTLQEGLETKLSGEAEVVTSEEIGFSATLRPLRTYRSKSGHWCREFIEVVTIDASNSERTGLACRVEGGWRRLRTEIKGEEIEPSL